MHNSSPPSAAYMRQWIGSALVETMAWRLFGAKPLSKPMLVYYQLDHKELTLVNFFSQISNFFIQENSFKNVVCEMAAFLSRGRWVNLYGSLCGIIIFTVLVSIYTSTNDRFASWLHSCQPFAIHRTTPTITNSYEYDYVFHICWNYDPSPVVILTNRPGNTGCGAACGG